jgi:murein L,D-transpeptidase YafK
MAPSKKLCTVDAELEVALGAGGMGKRAQRDKKTPLGSYAVGKARSSSRYRRFIPIGYPTAAQRRAGYSGSDVGIHGPDPMFTWEGTVDWTNGCIALKKSEDLDVLVVWTDKWQPKQIEIVE